MYTLYTTHESAINDLVRIHVCRLVRQRGFHRQEKDDLMQDIRLHVLTRIDRFDEAVGCSILGFVEILIERKIASIVRHRFAQRRHPDREEQSLNEVLQDDGNDGQIVERHETMTDRRAETSRRLRLKFSDALEDAPEHLVRAFHAMNLGSTSAAARRLHFDPKRMSHCVEALQVRLRDAVDV